MRIFKHPTLLSFATSRSTAGADVLVKLRGSVNYASQHSPALFMDFHRKSIKRYDYNANDAQKNPRTGVGQLAFDAERRERPLNFSGQTECS
jgi:hypothetical protein